MNVLVDMNLPSGWADFLTGAGHTAVEWSDEGQPNASDRDVLVWAAARQYVLLTADLDASALNGVAPAPGVIVLPCGDLTPAVQGHAVLAVIHKRGADLGTGAVIQVAANEPRKHA
jgi:predicted nuclease of predicted toxin-antitoxin system